MRFGGASLLAEIVLRTAGEEPQPDLFALIGSALGRIESEPVASVEAVVLSEVWRLIACLGFAPEIERCIDCDRRIADDEDVKFDYAAGGVRCLDCATGEAGQPIPARARLALIAMAARNDVGIERTRGHWTLLQRYLQHHVLEGAQLRSLAFLADARAGDPCDD
jgi:recombinational DNA repair protein (RecF pathway)